MLVKRYQDAHGNGEDKEIRAEITRNINASPNLHNKRELIENFMDRIHTCTGEIDEAWQDYIAQAQHAELQTIIEEETCAKTKPEHTWNKPSKMGHYGPAAPL